MSLPKIYSMGPELKPDGTYCAPWCGRGCTKAEHDAAQRDGAALAALLGDGWKPVVRENLGWHYNAVSPCNRIEVHRHGSRRFTAYLNHPGKGGGLYVGKATTAPAAVRNVVAKAREHIRELQTLVEGL